jgi:hypothetical protein
MIRSFISFCFLLLFVANTLQILWAHNCYDCENSLIKSTCCSKKTKGEQSIKSRCNCCNNKTDIPLLYKENIVRDKLSSGSPLVERVIENYVDGYEEFFDIEIEVNKSILPIFKQTLRFRI